MRYLAITHNSDTAVRIMVVPIEHGAALLFTYDSHCDRGCTDDCWFELIAEAITCAVDDYHVLPDEWFAAEDPPAHCQHDWLTPARVPGREIGDPCFGRLELFMNGEWNEIDTNNPPEIEIDYAVLTRMFNAPHQAG